MKNLLVLVVGCLLAAGFLFNSGVMKRLVPSVRPVADPAVVSLRSDQLTPVSGRPTLPPVQLSAPVTTPVRDVGPDSPARLLQP